MKTSKMHNLIDFILMIFPLLLIALSIYRTGELNFNSIESYFSWARTLDFGLFDYINSNMLGDISSPVLFLMVDLMIYYLYWRLFDLVYCLLGFFIDIIKNLAKKWGGLND